MTLTRTCAVIALVAATTVQAGTPVGHAEAGKAKATTVCSGCHGADGNTTLDGSYPRLAGQYPDYLAKALHDYKSGKRTNPIMAGQAQGLSEQEIADLAAYFGSLPGDVHDLSHGKR
jgi:cytochrome c553